MSHENTSENYNVTVEETDDLPVIKMNSSEFFLIPTVPVLLRKSYRLVPNRIIKLRTSFPLDRPASRILKRSVDIFISSIAIIT
ncbi:MAG TPA: hypothetical protein VET23_13870, partial [Chitinophagaceae bacterium]|nr:hypothetical protein [Chitinophagaceae bacterium]